MIMRFLRKAANIAFKESRTYEYKDPSIISPDCGVRQTEKKKGV